ncbi:MAG: ORF6N domain-containing protein [Candidatus Omnitrophica bacterium]|nr:ORF6N domain-containing protein [Candidatus Omnitrophota bacterium]
MSRMVVVEQIERKICFVRGMKVMLDYDLALLYGIETKQLKRAVKRNLSRFPNDFMMELTRQEYDSLRCQFGTFKRGQHAKYMPYAFTEQGIAMLSSVLNSDRAIQVNIAIMRAFVQLREALSTHKELALQFRELERKVGKHDGDIQAIFRAIQRLMVDPEKPKDRIGFHP